MANLVQNRLVIQGPPEELADLRKHLTIDRDGDAVYKRDIFGFDAAWAKDAVPEDPVIDLHVITKWGPPIDTMFGISEDYPNLSIVDHFITEGEGAGIATARHGDLPEEELVESPGEVQVIVNRVLRKFPRESNSQFERRKEEEIAYILENPPERESRDGFPVKELLMAGGLVALTAAGLYFSSIKPRNTPG